MIWLHSLKSSWNHHGWHKPPLPLDDHFASYKRRHPAIHFPCWEGVGARPVDGLLAQESDLSLDLQGEGGRRGEGPVESVEVSSERDIASSKELHRELLHRGSPCVGAEALCIPEFCFIPLHGASGKRGICDSWPPVQCPMCPQHAGTNHLGHIEDLHAVTSNQE